MLRMKQIRDGRPHIVLHENVIGFPKEQLSVFVGPGQFVNIKQEATGSLQEISIYLPTIYLFKHLYLFIYLSIYLSISLSLYLVEQRCLVVLRRLQGGVCGDFTT